MNNGQHAGRPAGKSALIPRTISARASAAPTPLLFATSLVQGQPGFYLRATRSVSSMRWPGDWAYTDDCYVDYIDGEYFLFDVLHPGIRIALFVVM